MWRVRLRWLVLRWSEVVVCVDAWSRRLAMPSPLCVHHIPANSTNITLRETLARGTLQDETKNISE